MAGVTASTSQRAAGGEALVTQSVVETAASRLRFDQIGEVKLKGFREPTELLLGVQGGE
jgi:adenylate cyclase